MEEQKEYFWIIVQFDDNSLAFISYDGINNHATQVFKNYLKYSSLSFKDVTCWTHDSKEDQNAWKLLHSPGKEPWKYLPKEFA